MAKKQIAYDAEAREAIRRGVKQLAKAVKVTLGPTGRIVVLEKSLRLARPSPRTASPWPRKSSWKTPTRTWAPRWSRKSPRKTSNVAGDGTTTATIYAEAIFDEGLKNVTAGANAMELKRGIDKAVEAIVDELKKMSKPVKASKEDRPGRHLRRQPGRRDRQDDRRGHGQGRQGRRHHRRGRQGPRRPTSTWSRACSSTRATSRPHFVNKLETMEVRAREPLHPDPREEDLRDQGPGAAAGEDRPVRQAAAHHRRGRRGRGPGHAGGQQAPRHAPVLRGQGPRLRRPPQGHAATTSPSSPAARPSSRTWASTSRTSRSPTSGTAKKVRIDKENTHDHRGRRQDQPTSRAASSRSSTRSRPPPATTTARSSRSGWPSWPAAWPRSTSAPPPRSR